MVLRRVTDDSCKWNFNKDWHNNEYTWNWEGREYIACTLLGQRGRPLHTSPILSLGDRRFGVRLFLKIIERSILTYLFKFYFLRDPTSLQL